MKILKGFRDFVFRGNVIDLAVGIVIGASFSALVNALVKDLLTPMIGAIAKVPDFSRLMFTINGSRFLYGDFVNVLISFLLTAAAIYFFIVLPVNTLLSKTQKHSHAGPTTKKCPECLSEIPVAATRCAYCTSKIS